MVDDDIGRMYDQVIAYLEAKKSYYADPNVSDSEFLDYKDFDLTSAINTIQMQVKNRPSIGEAATIRGYRDIRASDAEYDIRLMSRAAYWSDALAEETDNIDKWNFNKRLTYLHMNGKDAGS